MASSSRSAARAWPFALNWITRRARPNKKGRQDFEEYIAGIGMLQANEERRQSGLGPLEHAIIITGIHQSTSDEDYHMTIAAATRDMRARGQHIVVHSRVTSGDTEDARFKGSHAFVDNIRTDDRVIRQSQVDPVPVRTSLMAKDSDSAPVGCIFNHLHGITQWYVLDDEHEMVYLESDKFYRVGEGVREYLAFWHPVLGKSCRATFLGNERAEPHSPDPLPTNLESGMEHLSIAGDPAFAHEEWVEPFAMLKRDVKRSVFFRASNGREVRTSWDGWECIQGDEVVFRCQGRATGNEY